MSRVRWAEIQQKPVEFPPLDHPIGKVTALRAELDARERVANRNQPGGYAGLDLAGTLPAARLPFGTTAGTCCEGHDSRLSDLRSPLAHTHAQSEVAGLLADLAGKAATGHGHAQADIAGLVAGLAAKLGGVRLMTSTDYARSANTLADIPDLDGFTGVAATDYAFVLFLLYQSATTTCGVSLSMNGPAAPAGRAPIWDSGIQVTGGPSTSAMQHKAQAAADALHTTASVDAANTPRVARFHGMWPVGVTPGPIRPRFAAEVNGTEIKVLKGSWLLIL